MLRTSYESIMISKEATVSLPLQHPWSTRLGIGRHRTFQPWPASSNRFFCFSFITISLAVVTSFKEVIIRTFMRKADGLFFSSSFWSNVNEFRGHRNISKMMRSWWWPRSVRTEKYSQPSIVINAHWMLSWGLRMGDVTLNIPSLFNLLLI